ncbi:MAG: TonB family protein [Acidobacteriota bacterium]
MKDRWTRSAAFLLALGLHLLIVLVGGRQYMTATSDPKRFNQAARRLPQEVNGRPVRFIYVKDMEPSKEPPLDPSRLSDVNRRGASPDPRKGSSPDPTSLGRSPVRQSGGPGDAPATRPSVQPSPGGPPSARPEPPGAPARAEQPSPRSEAAAPSRPARNVEAKPVKGKPGREIAPGTPSEAEKGLPVGDAGEAASSPTQRPVVADPHRAEAGRPGAARPGALASQIQQMMVGSLQGGYDNPNASRLNTGALSFDTAAWDLGPYARQVQERVESNWRIPQAQMVLRQKGWVAIRFSIQKDGRITDIYLDRPSGIPSYDQSAMNALISSNPLPPLPEQVTAPELSAVFRFFYNIPQEE